MNKRIILASASPRRQQLLTQAGIPHEVIISGADETVTGSPAEQVKEVAMRKAKAVSQLLNSPSNTIIIAADTLVCLKGEIMGKPATREEAFGMLKKLQGNTHEVYTGVVLLKNAKATVFVDTAEVTFRPFCDEEIEAYIATEEPFDKAGAYGIQERGAALVDRVNGDFYTVMGLPVSKVCAALAHMGFEYWKA